MALNQRQFDVLTCLEKARCAMTQRELAKQTGVSLGTINKTVTSLEALGCVDEAGITEHGLEALEPYRVRRAVFLAAGFGSRLVPVTLNTPKPLVRV